MILYIKTRELDMPNPYYFRRLSQCLVGWWLLGATLTASAEPPMWVVEDENSRIYLYGTVHLPDPAIEWRTTRVLNALDYATQLWEEVPMPSTLAEMQAAQGPVMVQRAISPGKPLSSLLTSKEQVQFERALRRSPNPDQLRMVLENMKPWFAVTILGISPLLNAGFEAGAEIEDIVLARLAREQGDAVLGFETIEQQADLYSGWTEEQQLAALRELLALSDEEFNTRIAAAAAAFRAWTTGDTTLVEANVERWRKGGDALLNSAMPFDAFVKNRNEDWAEQIVELLARDGVAFVAIGAGHLVGPDGVLSQLQARGVEVGAY